MLGLMQPVKGQGRRPHRTSTGRVLVLTESGSDQDTTGTGMLENQYTALPTTLPAALYPRPGIRGPHLASESPKLAPVRLDVAALGRIPSPSSSATPFLADTPSLVHRYLGGPRHRAAPPAARRD